VNHGSWWIGFFQSPDLQVDLSSLISHSPPDSYRALIPNPPTRFTLKNTKFPPTRTLASVAQPKENWNKTSKIAIPQLAIESHHFFTSMTKESPLQSKREWMSFTFTHFSRSIQWQKRANWVPYAIGHAAFLVAVTRVSLRKFGNENLIDWKCIISLWFLFLDIHGAWSVVVWMQSRRRFIGACTDVAR